MTPIMSELDTPLPKSKPSVMKRILRGLLWLFLLILSLIIVVPLAALMFFDANQYKTEISTHLTQKSGLPIDIKGDLKLKFFPWIGLEVIDLSIDQAPQFGEGTFIAVKELGFKVPLREIFKLHFAMDTLFLKEVSIHLVKDSNGKTNWDYFIEKLNSANKTEHKTPEHPSNPNSKTSSSQNPKKLHFSLAQYEISNATLVYEDRQQNQRFILDKVSLTGKGQPQNNAYPLESKFHFAYLTNDEKNALRGQGNVKGYISKNKDATFDTTFSLDFPANYPFKQGELTTKLDMNKNQILLSNLNFKADKTHISGSITIPAASNLPLQFKLQTNEIDFDKLGKGDTSKTSANEKSSPSVVALTPNKKLPSSSKQQAERTVKGELTINQVMVKGLTLKNVKTSLRKDGSMLTLNPLTADLYQGSLATKIQYDLANKNGTTSFSGKIYHIALDPLLGALKQKQPISGNADVTFDLSHSNSKLNGTTRLDIKNGTLKGVDVNYYLERARAMIKKEEFSLEDSKQTLFNSLSGTLKINNNVIDNNDLTLSATDFMANGVGEVDLNSQTIAYKIQAKKIYHDGQEHPNALPLAIRIKGSLEKPRVLPDFDLYLKALLEKGVKQKFSKEMDRQISKILKEEDNPDKTREELLQEKIEEKLNKGLEKIFKF